MNTLLAQSLTLVVFLVFLWVASRGITSLKKIGTIAGTSVFVMSMLYILLMVAAPAIRGIEIATTNITLKSIIPNFDFTYFTTLSMLVFAVGGAEKISPYVNNMNKPSKEFPRGMIVLAAMVAVSALLGSMAMGMMFDANNIPKDLMMNGQYYAFKMLGEYYGWGPRAQKAQQQLQRPPSAPSASSRAPRFLPACTRLQSPGFTSALAGAILHQSNRLRDVPVWLHLLRTAGFPLCSEPRLLG